MRYRLSICIPAYDRSHCLDELIASIVTSVGQGPPVQICISDDAAPPSTGLLVQQWQARYPHIAYYRFSDNGGIDRGILKAVELAEGDYCWLMGDDDKVEPGAPEVISQKIDDYGRPTALNINGSLYDRDLGRQLYPRVRRGLKKNRLQRDTAFESLDAILEMFGDSFGFLGDNVFRRDLWNEIVSENDIRKYDGTIYVHLAILLMMLRKSPRLVYVHERCVGFRGGNDSHLKVLGEVRRLKADIEGYHRVAAGVFSQSDPLYRNWMSRIIAVHVRGRVWGIKRSGSRQAIRETLTLTYHYYWRLPAFWFYLAPMLFFPRWTLLGVRSVYHATNREL